MTNWRTTDSTSKKPGRRAAVSAPQRPYWLVVVALVLAALAGFVFWYGREQSAPQVIPLLEQAGLNCDVQLYFREQSEGYEATLTQEQVEQVLVWLEKEPLSRSRGDLLHLSGHATGQESTMGRTVRLYFWQKGSNQRCEVLLLGDRLLVNDLYRDQHGIYTTPGGQAAQEALYWQLYAQIVPEYKKQTLTTLRPDFDGDGIEDVVRLCTTPYMEQQEDGAWAWVEGRCRYTLEWERAGEVVARTQLSGPEGHMELDKPAAFVTQDQQGNQLVGVSIPLPSNGGAGEVAISVLSWQEGSPVELPMPSYTVRGSLAGMTASVQVPETGNAEQLDLNWWLQERGASPILEESGALVWPQAPSQADGICAVRPGVQGIRMAQYVWGTAHTDAMGWLVTHLTWNNGQPTVVEQTFSWLPQTVDEALQ